MTFKSIHECNAIKRSFFSSFNANGKYILSIEMWLLLITIVVGLIPTLYVVSGGNDDVVIVSGAFGVNVLGWIKGDFGGGTTARCVILGLMSCQIPISAVSISGAELHSHTNTVVSAMGIEEKSQDFMFDLFLINAANTVPVLRNKTNHISHIHYRIGLWHWETSYLPLEQGESGKYYDEIWAPSAYVARAILQTPTFPASTMVQVIPYGYETLPGIVTDEVRMKARAQLPDLLPVDASGAVCARCSLHAPDTLRRWSAMNDSLTLFLIVFDFDSDYKRKNIVGSVEAFLKAFPAAGLTINTGLIIKSSHAMHQWSDYEHLKWVIDETDTHRRIVLLDGVLPHSQLSTLKMTPDCYISLHRSEGWGLNIMEAVLMGIPVIATAHGGSEQFLRPLYENRAPVLRVPYELVNVSRAFGPYSTDMMWAEPSFGAAVFALRHMHSFLGHYQSVAVDIRDEAVTTLSPERTGDGMKQRLQVLRQCLCLTGRLRYSAAQCEDVVAMDSAAMGGSASATAVGGGRGARDRYAQFCEKEVLGMRSANFPSSTASQTLASIGDRSIIRNSKWMGYYVSGRGREKEYHLGMDVPIVLPPR